VLALGGGRNASHNRKILQGCVCLDGERISERIPFGLVVENSVRLMIFWEM
jgi:hypothetical protein